IKKHLRPKRLKSGFARAALFFSVVIQEAKQRFFLRFVIALDTMNTPPRFWADLVDRHTRFGRLDNSRINVRGATDGRRVAKLFGNILHDLDDVLLNVTFALRCPDLGELDRRQQRSSPSAKILRRKLRRRRFFYIRVDIGRLDRSRLTVFVEVMKQFPDTAELLEILHHSSELFVDEDLAMFDVALSDEVEHKLAAAFDLEMLVLQRRDAVGSIVMRALLRS